ncbi:MAG: 6-phosphogluconolactonase [Candidatus Eremiobacteraeota bacterium]|nr:6-phosphogluconolactonase [Candidatus Eremiobacteraeota bacterium]
MRGELRVYPAAADVAVALAQLFADCAASAVAQRGSFAVSLAGGTTPKAAYALLAQPPFAMSVDWHATQIFFGDERCVPPGDPQSNYTMARDAFMRAVDIPEQNVHRIRGEDDPNEAASSYRRELLQTLGENPRFDLVLLGMGPDGHTASLFPGQDPMTENDRLVRAVYSTSQSQWRITLTPKMLDAGRTIAFAVEGSAKSQTLEAVLHGPPDYARYPSQAIAPSDGRLIWLVDAAAASLPDLRTP